MRKRSWAPRGAAARTGFESRFGFRPARKRDLTRARLGLVHQAKVGSGCAHYAQFFRSPLSSTLVQVHPRIPTGPVGRIATGAPRRAGLERAGGLGRVPAPSTSPAERSPSGPASEGLRDTLVPRQRSVPTPEPRKQPRVLWHPSCGPNGGRSTGLDTTEKWGPLSPWVGPGHVAPGERNVVPFSPTSPSASTKG